MEQLVLGAHLGPNTYPQALDLAASGAESVKVTLAPGAG